MKLYHRTTHDVADAILNGGFRMSARLTSRPLTTGGEALLVVDIPELVVEEYETHESRGYRTFQVPARIVNVARIVRGYPAKARSR